MVGKETDEPVFIERRQNSLPQALSRNARPTSFAVPCSELASMSLFSSLHHLSFLSFLQGRKRVGLSARNFYFFSIFSGELQNLTNLAAEKTQAIESAKKAP